MNAVEPMNGRHGWTGGAVVVGVDGSPRSDNAVRWAADEALARGARLVVLHAIDFNSLGLWGTTASLRADARAIVQPLVDRSIEVAHGRHPDLVVTGRALVGMPTRMLPLVSGGAQLVVVGRNGRGALARAWLGNVPQRVLALAACPAVVVGDQPVGTPKHHIGRIVAGCADDDSDQAVLAFACSTAAARGVPLLVTHAVRQPAGLVLPTGRPAGFGRAVIDAEERLAKELVEWQTRYPEVDVRVIARTGSPRHVLTEACHSNDLLVLGHHHHAPYLPRQLGANTTAILRDAPCSVAVVRPDTRQGGLGS